MASCHQAHNIPWQGLEDYLELVLYRNNPHPPYLRAKRCPTEEEKTRLKKKLGHFICRLEATIADFAATERRKYDMNTILKRETVFDDRFLDDILTPKFQSLNFWRSRQWCSPSVGYDGIEEANVIKELFNVGNMEAILLLVHTGGGIQDLEVRSTHIAGFGFYDMAQECLEMYVLLNHLIASGDIQHPHRWHSVWKRTAYRVCEKRDAGDAQPRVFKSYLTGSELGFVDYSVVTDLLKYCFRILYQYKMIAEEIHGKFIPHKLLLTSFIELSCIWNESVSGTCGADYYLIWEAYRSRVARTTQESFEAATIHRGAQCT